MSESMVQRRGRHWRDDVEHNTREINLLALHQPTEMHAQVRIAQGAARIPSPPVEPGLDRTAMFPPPALAQIPVPQVRELPLSEVETTRLVGERRGSGFVRWVKSNVGKFRTSWGRP